MKDNDSYIDLTLIQKIAIISISCLIVWVIIFAISLLITHDNWWFNALITFVMTVFAGYGVTAMDFGECDHDMMP